MGASFFVVYFGVLKIYNLVLTVCMINPFSESFKIPKLSSTTTEIGELMTAVTELITTLEKVIHFVKGMNVMSFINYVTPLLLLFYKFQLFLSGVLGISMILKYGIFIETTKYITDSQCTQK